MTKPGPQKPKPTPTPPDGGDTTDRDMHIEGEVPPPK